MTPKAVALGSKIIMAATLASTLQPTKELIQTVAAEAGKEIEMIDLVCESAWAKFEADDQAGYLQEIAQALQQNASAGDVIVLAQASMAAATDLCPDLPIPVLSSPRLGLEAALKVCRS